MLEGYQGAGKAVEREHSAIVRRVDGLEEFGSIRKERKVFDIRITDSYVNEGISLSRKSHSLCWVVGNHLKNSV